MAPNEQITVLFQQVAVLLLETVKSKVGRRPWRRGYLDKRYSVENNGVALSKCRIELANGEFLNDVPFPRGTAGISQEAFEVRTNSLPKTDWWYGVLITVHPDGQCEVKFDYDPNCLSKMDMQS